MTSSDLKPRHEQNKYNKYADDVYLAVSGGDALTIQDELHHINEWALKNNLKLNPSKTKEMIVYRRGVKIDVRNAIPVMDGIERVQTMKILGVQFDGDMLFRGNVEKMVGGAASSLYAIKILRSKGLKAPSLWDITSQTAVSRMTYASPAWWGYLEAKSKERLEAIINRLKRLSCLPPDYPSFANLCETADNKLFKDILINNEHVLNHLLPETKSVPYSLRSRTHNRNLPKLTNSLQQRSFINRMLFNHIY